MTELEFELELKKRKYREKRQMRAFVAGVLLWAGVLWTLLYGAFGIALVDGNSMRPAYRDGDLVLYMRSFTGEPDYGDVIILHMGAQSNDIQMLKRIAGKPGDVIRVDENGYLERNGERIEEPEVKFGYQGGDAVIQFPYTVPEGRYFYLGDNRPVSVDSRVLGAVREDAITGKVIGMLRLERSR